MRQKSAIFLIAFIGLFLLASCDFQAEGSDETSPTQVQVEETRNTTPMKVCTPPPCGENEAYYCPDECPGGCGTICATHTPAPPDESNGSIDEEAEATTINNVQDFPDSSKYSWQPVVDGLEKPLAVVPSGDGSGRLFMLEQPGRIRIFTGSELLSKPFLDITRQVIDRGNEQGLLGLAFHPDFDQNGFFFINYTGEGGDTFVSQFQVSEDTNLADMDSEKILLRIKQPYSNHNGGQLLFGQDGNLYIGTGDGGSADDPEGNAQNLQSLLGKMLRINVDHGEPYSIPSDNPFSRGGGLPEIWATGLRNPWRYNFDPLTGDLYIADVGQNQWEEINFLAAGPDGLLPAGANFGWDYWEGTHRFEGEPPEGISMVSPIWEYDHSKGCSITGGSVYRGMMEEWQGIYIYADFCTGTIWGLLQGADGTWRNETLFQTKANITSFGEDEFGEIYLIDRGGTISILIESP